MFLCCVLVVNLERTLHVSVDLRHELIFGPAIRGSLAQSRGSVECIVWMCGSGGLCLLACFGCPFLRFAYLCYLDSL